MTLAGMDVTEVRQLAGELRRAADQLHSLVSTLDGRVSSTGWTGRDADIFKHQWWPQHRQAVLHAADTIQGLGQSASNNADDQERTSSTNASGIPTARTAPYVVGGIGAAVAAAGGAIGVAAGGSAAASGAGPQGPGTFPNAAIVQAAAAHQVGSHGGQCRAFVSQVVSDATGGKVDLQAYANPQHDYFTALEQQGTRMTDVSQLRPGDVVQIGEFESDPHLHSFIIDGTPSQKPDGTWSVHVIDSNSDWHETVRAYDRQISLSDETRAYRLGRV